MPAVRLLRENLLSSAEVEQGIVLFTKQLEAFCAAGDPRTSPNSRQFWREHSIALCAPSSYNQGWDGIWDNYLSI